LITEKPKGGKGKRMLYRLRFAQIMNRFMEQSFDWNIDQEQILMCKNETGKIDMRRLH